ncbi:MAG: hypothetical protein ACFE95_10510 [Candidatus Hodarchaeota archaeon]
MFVSKNIREVFSEEFLIDLVQQLATKNELSVGKESYMGVLGSKALILGEIYSYPNLVILGEEILGELFSNYQCRSFTRAAKYFNSKEGYGSERSIKYLDKAIQACELAVISSKRDDSYYYLFSDTIRPLKQFVLLHAGKEEKEKLRAIMKEYMDNVEKKRHPNIMLEIAELKIGEEPKEKTLDYIKSVEYVVEGKKRRMNKQLIFSEQFVDLQVALAEKTGDTSYIDATVNHIDITFQSSPASGTVNHAKLKLKLIEGLYRAGKIIRAKKELEKAIETIVRECKKNSHQPLMGMFKAEAAVNAIEIAFAMNDPRLIETSKELVSFLGDFPHIYPNWVMSPRINKIYQRWGLERKENTEGDSETPVRVKDKAKIDLDTLLQREKGVLQHKKKTGKHDLNTILPLTILGRKYCEIGAHDRAKSILEELQEFLIDFSKLDALENLRIFPIFLRETWIKRLMAAIVILQIKLSTSLNLQIDKDAIIKEFEDHDPSDPFATGIFVYLFEIGKAFLEEGDVQIAKDIYHKYLYEVKSLFDPYIASKQAELLLRLNEKTEAKHLLIKSYNKLTKSKSTFNVQLFFESFLKLGYYEGAKAIIDYLFDNLIGSSGYFSPYENVRILFSDENLNDIDTEAWTISENYFRDKMKEKTDAFIVNEDEFLTFQEVRQFLTALIDLALFNEAKKLAMQLLISNQNSAKKHVKNKLRWQEDILDQQICWSDDLLLKMKSKDVTVIPSEASPVDIMKKRKAMMKPEIQRRQKIRDTAHIYNFLGTIFDILAEKELAQLCRANYQEVSQSFVEVPAEDGKTDVRKTSKQVKEYINQHNYNKAKELMLNQFNLLGTEAIKGSGEFNDYLNLLGSLCD